MSCVIEGNELVVISGKSNWIPAIGQIFYVPDILSEREPVAKFIWHGGSSDMRLLAFENVFKTPEEALERYTHIGAVLFFINN